MFFIHVALDKKYKMCPSCKLTVSHLYTVRHSSTCMDMLPKEPVSFGKKQKKYTC